MPLFSFELLFRCYRLQVTKLQNLFVTMQALSIPFSYVYKVTNSKPIKVFKLQNDLKRLSILLSERLQSGYKNLDL